MTYRARCAGRRNGNSPKRFRELDPVNVVSSSEILKYHWPHGSYQERPLWAAIAYKFGWISFIEKIRAKPWPDAPWIDDRITALMYTNNPFFAVLPKSGAQ